MENRRKRWYDLFGLLPRNLGRLLLWFSLIPIAFIIVLLVYAWRADQYELDEVLAPLENCAAYDRNGQWIGTLTDHDRVYVARNELPDNLVNAFVAREDEDFFEHGGIVYSSIIRSICRNLTTLSYAQGASTITMQLARNCYELGGKTLDRKVLEMAVARRIEGKYSKDEILTAYLNRIYFGQQCYGIAQAADLYFGKKVADLTLAECATLAGLVRGPSIYNPVYSPEAAAKVRNATLERMFECEFITQEQLWQALREPMAVAGKREARPGSYPVLVVSRELGDLDCCDEQEGTSSIFVMTTLDLEFQRMVEDVSEPMLVALESSSVWAGLPKRVDNQLNRCVQAAILCVDSRKGDLLAVTGGRSAQDGLDRWQSKVMPGDLFTPIVNLCAVDQRRTVIRSNPEVTGRGVGFNTVIETAQKAGYKGELPRSSDLYTGRFSVPLSHAVNALYLIGNDGFNVSISSVRQVGTTKKNLVMVNAPSPEESRREILPRESATWWRPFLPSATTNGPGKPSSMSGFLEIRGIFPPSWGVISRFLPGWALILRRPPSMKKKGFPRRWQKPVPLWPGRCMTVRRKVAEKLSGNAGSGKMLQNRAPNEVQFSISRSIMRHSLEMTTAIQAAKSAGAFLKKHFYEQKKVDEASQNDIKLELDKLSQKLITEEILSVFPNHAVLGEEGYTGDRNSEYEWIVDPIDGTVNYFYTIPWFCVSIALRRRGEVVLGVIYDPMMDECWHVEKGGIPYMNDHPMHCSRRERMAEAVVLVGHGKTDGSKEKGIERFARIAWQVRKVRNNGSAALALAYIACGRFDAYVESVISIWDVAVGVLLVEAAGGKVVLEPKEDNPEQFAIVAWNGRIPIMEALGE